MAGLGCSLWGQRFGGECSAVRILTNTDLKGVTGGDIKTHTVTLRYRTLV